MKKYNKKCAARRCGKEFETNKAHQIFCNRKCRITDNYLRQERELIPACPATVGAISELIASTDLLRNGYSVFRALSPACTSDLVAFRNARNDVVYRIQVVTGYKTHLGRIFSSKSDKHKDYDILAIVVGGNVTYRPELPK